MGGGERSKREGDSAWGGYGAGTVGGKRVGRAGRYSWEEREGMAEWGSGRIADWRCPVADPVQILAFSLFTALSYPRKSTTVSVSSFAVLESQQVQVQVPSRYTSSVADARRTFPLGCSVWACAETGHCPSFNDEPEICLLKQTSKEAVPLAE